MSQRSKKHPRSQSNKTRNEQPQKKRSLLLPLLGVITVFGILWSQYKRPTPEKETRAESTPHTHVASSASAEKLVDSGIAQAKKDRQVHLALLASYADDPEIKLLAEFFSRCAIYKFYLAPGVSGSHIPPDVPKPNMSGTPSWEHPRGFYIQVASFEERKAMGLSTFTTNQFSGQHNTLYVPREGTYSRTWSEVLFLHELKHAYDLNTGAEPERSQGEDWLRGEYRAYRLEFRLLNKKTNGEMDRILEQTATNLGPPPEGTLYSSPPLADAARLNALFEPMKDEREEAAARLGTYTVALSFKVADVYKKGDRWKLNALKALAKENGL